MNKIPTEEQEKRDHIEWLATIRATTIRHAVTEASLLLLLWGLLAVAFEGLKLLTTGTP